MFRRYQSFDLILRRTHKRRFSFAAINSQIIQNIEDASTGQEVFTHLKQCPSVERDIWTAALRKLNEMDYMQPNIVRICHEIREHTTLDSESSFQLIRAMTKTKRYRLGSEIMEQIYSQGVPMTSELEEAYIRFYAGQNPHQAIEFFDALERRTERGYMYVIKACTKAGEYEQGLKYFQQFPNDGLEYNKFVFSSAFNCVSKLQDLDIANKIFDIWKAWCEKNELDYRAEPYMITILMNIYHTTNDVQKGAQLFNGVIGADWMQRIEDNHVIFSTFLSLLEKTGQSKYADALLEKWDTNRFFNFDEPWGNTELEGASYICIYWHKLRVVRLVPHSAQAMIRFALKRWKDEEIEDNVAIITGAGYLRDNLKELLETLDPPLEFDSYLEQNRKRIGFTLTRQSVQAYQARHFKL